ncbi:uncharacterized protein KIAA1614 homolog isoform X4 [Denticeps clupeoides]|uniref:uncharacterized protein KIAA1614 homolog isoform X4 n=1 Tax=Denticeps clupeoides TaxID=299321 RepID=UPI0010A2BDEB|nr:uncharacterized protein KIAA1614-like isoform X4 [Denticeps clupeoides]
MEEAVVAGEAPLLLAVSHETGMPKVQQRVPDDQNFTNSDPKPCYQPCGSQGPPARLQTAAPSGSAVSALQSKVKNLSKRKGPGRHAAKRVLDKKGAFVPCVLGASVSVTWGSSSSDEDEENQVQTYLPIHLGSQTEVCGGVCYDSELASGWTPLPRELGEGTSLENLSGECFGSSEQAPKEKPWIPPKGYWKVTRPETLVLNGDTPATRTRHEENLSLGQRKCWSEERQGLQRPDSLEGHLRPCGQDRAGPAALAGGLGLWRADSMESVCSSGSALSLAEKVEMNRNILKQMLNKAKNVEEEKGTGPEADLRTEDSLQGNSRVTKSGIVPNDSDWDSGISLQESEHSQRAFVSGDELPLSPRHEQAKRLLERARMKARSHPLKADHTILPVQRENPEPLSRGGGQGCRAALTGKEGVVSGNQSDSSSGDSAGGPHRRHGQSPTRVRFEDESEKDAEVRYLERLRQRRRVGEKAQGLLISKPNLSVYVNGGGDMGRAVGHGQGLEGIQLWNRRTRKTQEGMLNGAGGHYKTTPAEDLNRQCNSCGTILDGVTVSNFNQGPNSQLLVTACANSEVKTIPCWIAPTLPNHMVRIEQIKESYIGSVKPSDYDGDREYHPQSIISENGDILKRLKKRGRREDGIQGSEGIPAIKGHVAQHQNTFPPSQHAKPRQNGAEKRLSNGTAALPPNPYAAAPTSQKVTGPPPIPPRLDRLTSKFPVSIMAALHTKKSVLKSGIRTQPGSQAMPLDCEGYGCHQEDRPDPQDDQNDCLPVADITHPGPLSSSSSFPCQSIKANPPAVRMHSQGNLALHTSVLKQQTSTGDLCPDLITLTDSSDPHSKDDRQLRGTVRSGQEREGSPSPTHRTVDADRPKMSLCRFFSAIGLNGPGKLSKDRSSSMDHLNIRGKQHSSTSPSSTHRVPGQLRKAPSLQSLRLQGSPFLQLKKSSSVQNLHSSKKKDRSSAYAPGNQPCSPSPRVLQRTLSVEDVSSPCGVRSVGRVSQAFPDGTLMLELNRPPCGPFGFLISRGKGRTDSGVYVEEMGDSSTQKLYAGLLGVGDEILEVNGEKVAGLSLEDVTWLMTQNSVASIRVLRQRQVQR